MANYTGPQVVDITSYDTFRAAVNGNGYNVNSDQYGAQCVDAFMLLNYNVGGYTFPYAKAEPNGYAYELWDDPTSRAWNASDKYTLIERLEDVQRGDMMVFGPSYYYPTFGHNTFADQNYNPSDPEHINALGQNQLNGVPFPGGGKCFNVESTLTLNFLGAFRLKSWNSTPPSPPVPPQSKRTSRLPLILMTRHLINPDSML